MRNTFVRFSTKLLKRTKGLSALSAIPDFRCLRNLKKIQG